MLEGSQGVSPARRWVADPLLLMGLLALLSVAALAWAWSVPWVLVLLAVVAAGLSLSGST